MALLRFGSIRRKKITKPQPTEESKDETASSVAESLAPTLNSLPSAPSTTELLLRSDTKQAKNSYQRAQEAERAYHAKKEAERARQDYSDSRRHLRSSCSELSLGVKAALRAAGSSPAVVKQHQNDTATRSELRKKERQLERQKKLDAKLKRMEEMREKIAIEKAEADAAGGADEAAAEPAAEPEAAPAEGEAPAEEAPPAEEAAPAEEAPAE